MTRTQRQMRVSFPEAFRPVTVSPMPVDKETDPQVIAETYKRAAAHRKCICSACPGFCCRWFTFGMKSLNKTAVETLAMLLASPLSEDEKIVIIKHFKPNGRSFDEVSDSGRIPSFHCTAQRRDGRCGVYARRPNLCRRHVCPQFGTGRFNVSVMGSESRKRMRVA